MLKAQLARALQLPMDTRAEQDLHLLLELDDSSAGSSPGPAAEERSCDRVIAMLRARLSSR
jgi:hypothetical protein